MSESDLKRLKTWFWTFLLGQLCVMIVGAAIFAGSIKTTMAQHSEDIKGLQANKADLQTVLRIKADADIRNQMILDQLKELNQGQRDLYDLMVKHIDGN